MRKPWYILGALLLIFALTLSACSGDDAGDDGLGQTPAATGQAALSTQAVQATQGAQPIDPLATGASATGDSAAAQSATSVVATPTPVLVSPAETNEAGATQAAATQAVATQAAAAPGVPATPLSTADPDVAATQAAAPAVQQSVQERPYLASMLLDMPVWNTLEGEVADVDGLVVDSATGNVHYVLVDDKSGLHPIPFSLFSLVDTDPTNNADPDDLSDLALLLPISSSQLETSPTIAAEDLDASVAGGWTPGIQNYWAQYGGALPVTGQEQPDQMGAPVYVRDAGLFGGIGYDVENYENEDLGDITNFVVNPGGTIEYAVMQTSSFLNIGAKRLLVPLRAMVFNPANRRFLLPVDNNWLDQAVNQAGLGDDVSPEFFWRDGWDEAAAAFWANFQPIQPPPGRVTPGVPTPLPALTPGATFTVPEDAMFSTARMSSVDIVAPNGNELGTVSNLAFAGDRLVYVIMNVAQGFAAVPWQAFQWDEANDRLVYQRDINLLAGVPAIRSADVFEGNDYTWETPIFDYWNERLEGTGQYRGFSNEPVVLYYTRLNGAGLVDAAGTDLGDVADVIVDGQGQVRYLVINRNGRLIPVPWNLFTWDAQRGSLVFTGDVARLDGAPSFNNLDELNLFDPIWDDPAEDFWR